MEVFSNAIKRFDLNVSTYMFQQEFSFVREVTKVFLSVTVEPNYVLHHALDVNM